MLKGGANPKLRSRGLGAQPPEAIEAILPLFLPSQEYK